VPVLSDEQAKRLNELIGMLDGNGASVKKLVSEVEMLREVVQGFQAGMIRFRETAVELRGHVIERTVPEALLAAPAKAWKRPVVQQTIGPHRPHGAIAEGLAKPHTRVLDALSWWEAAGQKQPQRVQVAMVAGYTVNGHFNNIIGELKTRDLVDYPGNGSISLTPSGRQLAAPQEAAPSRDELIRRVRAVLKTEPREKVFDVLVEAGAAMLREEVATAAGYTVNGHFNNIVGEMNSLGVVEYPQRGYVGLNRQLFGE
jgi:hypothetical protein